MLIGLSLCTSASRGGMMHGLLQAEAFANATGRLDISYDGFLLNQSFENLREITSVVKPEVVFSDAEKFPPYQEFVATINMSANAAARRLPGESDCALAARISNAFLARWTAVMGGSALYFYGDTPQSGHGSHGPWLSEALAAYGETIVPQFGM
jgi:hypothetical protein